MTALENSIRESMSEFADDAPLCVALSGGMDSVALLHSLVSLRRFSSIRALHINHRLSDNADDWQEQCKELCQILSIPFQSISVNVRDKLGAANEGLEAMARSLRYEAFDKSLNPDETLLLAHHGDDQYETLLLRMMRGSGVRGLAAIPPQRSLGQGRLFRPLLQVPRSELADYAKRLKLDWVDDESNQNTLFDRNFCRHEVLPLLERRWPDYRSSMAKSIQLLAEADELMNALAQIDMASAATASPAKLQLSSLRVLSASRLRNVIRYWLTSLGLGDVGWKKLHAAASAFGSNEQKTKTFLSTLHFQLIGHDGCLHVVPAHQPIEEVAIAWDIAQGDCVLPNNGRLSLSVNTDTADMVIDRKKMTQVQVCYRSGGETLKLPGRPTKSLKKLLQEHKVAPWLRQNLPLLFVSGELAFVPGVGVSENFAGKVEGGCTIEWLDSDFNWPVNAKSN